MGRTYRAVVVLASLACRRWSPRAATTKAAAVAAARPREVTTLKVGVIPIADVAPLYLGIDRASSRRSSSRSSRSSPRAARRSCPSVVSGDYQIGFSNTTSLIIAASKDLPVQIIAQGVLGGTGEDDAWDGAARPEGRPRSRRPRTSRARRSRSTRSTTSAQLDDQQRRWRRTGADYTKLKYVEVPFPDMNAALESGRVDARLRGRAGRLGRQGRRRQGALEPLRGDGAEPHRRHLLHEQAVHRREPRRRRPLRARDAEVARVRVSRTRTRCARRSPTTRRSRRRRPRRSSCRSGGPTSTSRRSSRPPSSRRSTASSRRCRRSTS